MRKCRTGSFFNGKWKKCNRHRQQRQRFLHVATLPFSVYHRRKVDIFCPLAVTFAMPKFPTQLTWRRTYQHMAAAGYKQYCSRRRPEVWGGTGKNKELRIGSCTCNFLLLCAVKKIKNVEIKNIDKNSRWGWLSLLSLSRAYVPLNKHILLTQASVFMIVCGVAWTNRVLRIDNLSRIY